MPGIFGAYMMEEPRTVHNLFTFKISQLGGIAGGTTPIFTRRRQTNIEVVCDGRPSGRTEELAPQNQDIFNTIGLQKIWSLRKMHLDGMLGREQEKQIISATLSHNITLALELIVSKLLGVFGSPAKPDIQGQAAKERFWEENNTGYTDNNVTFVKVI